MAYGTNKTSKMQLSTIETNDATIPRETHSDELADKNGDECSLAYEFRHFFRAMGLFGLYYTPKSWQMKSGKSNCNSFLFKMHRFYCFVVQLVIWFNFIRMIPGFWIGDDASLQYEFVPVKICFAIWNLQCAVYATIWYCLCGTEKLPAIMETWQTKCQSSPESRMFGTALSTKWVRKSLRVVVAVASWVTLCNVALPLIAVFGPFESIRNDTRFALAPLSYDDAIWVAVLVPVVSLGNIAFVYPVAFFVFICMIITYQFQALTNFFTTNIGKDGRFSKSIEGLRRQHQYLAKVVFLLDDAFSFYLAAAVLANIVLACFALYTLFISDILSSALTKFIMVFWLSGVGINFAILGVFAAQLSDKAHDIVNYIHDIGVFTISDNQDAVQINMFLAKLNGPPIAFTMWNILPITKEFILTVVGVFITYYALVAQSI